MNTLPYPSYLERRRANGLSLRRPVSSKEERIAIHEAGHAVFSNHLGLPVDRVSIVPFGKFAGICWRCPLAFDVLLRQDLKKPVGSLARGITDAHRALWPTQRTGFIRRRLLVVVAGAVAVNVLTNDCLAVASTDSEEALELARLLDANTPERVLDDAQTVCANEIESKFSAPIRHLAGRLIAEREVSGDEVARICNEFPAL